ncbi:MAG: squalene/phytoene synthase family protein, partial [Verrucomicrobiota bacterium]|nr:squalene/phytoene synthase family protein [Verrucomicrobiota bacterium]
FICRKLDDWADEGNADLLQDAMDAWQNNLPHELLDHYRFLQAHWGLESKPLTELMQAMLMEQQSVRMDSEARLLEYCHGVAGTIGLMLCPIFGVKDEKALEQANNLGIAMQLTNICRDVFEDAENDRIYLPADLFSSVPTTADLTSKDCDSREAYTAAKERLLQMADELYTRSDAGIDYLPLTIRIVVRWASRMYREIGNVIRTEPERFHENRAVVGQSKKMFFLIKCITRSLYKK